jgi:hypothetical protein
VARPWADCGGRAGSVTAYARRIHSQNTEAQTKGFDRYAGMSATLEEKIDDLKKSFERAEAKRTAVWLWLLLICAILFLIAWILCQAVKTLRAPARVSVALEKPIDVVVHQSRPAQIVVQLPKSEPIPELPAKPLGFGANQLKPPTSGGA